MAGKDKAKKDPETSVIVRVKTIKLRKHKTKDGEFLVCDGIWDEETHSKHGADVSEVSRTGSREVHTVFSKAFKLLVPHFLMLSELKEIADFNKEYLEKRNILEDEKLETFAVTGLHFKEKDENPYVMIIGRKIRKDNRVMSVTVPMQSLVPSEDGYIYTEDLLKCVNDIRACYGEYLEGKFAPRQDLFNSGEEQPPAMSRVA